MPIFEYKCEKCGRFEKLTSSIEVDPQIYQKCPECGQVCHIVEWSIPAKRDPRYGLG